MVVVVVVMGDFASDYMYNVVVCFVVIVVSPYFSTVLCCCLLCALLLTVSFYMFCFCCWSVHSMLQVTCSY